MQMGERKRGEVDERVGYQTGKDIRTRGCT